MLISKLTNKIPRFFNMSMGDTHIYNSHIIPAHKQQLRIPYKFPNITFPDILNISDIQNLKYEDFTLTDYKYHAAIKAEMIV
jgi:thymidylate synthase